MLWLMVDHISLFLIPGLFVTSCLSPYGSLWLMRTNPGPAHTERFIIRSHWALTFVSLILISSCIFFSLYFFLVKHNHFASMFSAAFPWSPFCFSLINAHTLLILFMPSATAGNTVRLDECICRISGSEPGPVLRTRTEPRVPHLPELGMKDPSGNDIFDANCELQA